MNRIVLIVAMIASIGSLSAREDVLLAPEFRHANDCIRRFLQSANPEKYAYLGDDKQPKQLWLCHKCYQWNFFFNKRCKACGARKGIDQ